ncbi:TRAP-type mannitol/chloroaromatic compound transport system, small permease component [Tistlia consotensis]|uniref:TRAP transporter small permease protein n=1 Tax=Tistlia consotensis USBA 355 TaxID=560819 RepID=A0A1Y6B4H1_9PROT|nr:TRAP transporter small permease subunit [Tistlia consotensis]SME89641.1 TRAP-type mannitol/chloroaromatic compound transport system, small permease component [Tistlia consotensis USBA 355]SNR26133.1 TRAP-type mannitol/chloroaromatic compound transport system, small permease component [Tistlia consotensis]
MHALLKISDGLSAVISAIGRLASWLFIPLALVIATDVVWRVWVGSNPALTESWFHREIGSTKMQEMEWHLHAALFLLCIGFAYLKDAHVRVEIVREKMSPRLRAWIELAGCLLFVLTYCYILLDFGIDFARRSWRTNEISSAMTGLSDRWIIKSMLPLCFTLLAAAAVSVLLRHVVYLFGPPELRRRSGQFVEVDHLVELKQETEEEIAAYQADHRADHPGRQ